MMQKQKHTNKHNHKPVLLEQVMDILNPQSDMSYLDLTAGRGGHADAILEHTDEKASITLVDRDLDAIKYLQDKYADEPRVKVIHNDFLKATIELKESNQMFDGILLDLGVSSPQFDNAERGFSFREDGPLDMRMNQKQAFSASDIVNHYSEQELSEMIFRYGDEKFSRRIAKAIVSKRPIHSTLKLAEIVDEVVPSKGRIHPATKTFQALRIAVNDELGQIERVLPVISDVLTLGGKLVVISFHSLEDRIVKKYLKSDISLNIITKKPIDGSSDLLSNPRARSAKLRAAVKIKISDVS